jgi:hypothetical protein
VRRALAGRCQAADEERHVKRLLFITGLSIAVDLTVDVLGLDAEARASDILQRPLKFRPHVDVTVGERLGGDEREGSGLLLLDSRL